MLKTRSTITRSACLWTEALSTLGVFLHGKDSSEDAIISSTIERAALRNASRYGYGYGPSILFTLRLWVLYSNKVCQQTARYTRLQCSTFRHTRWWIMRQIGRDWQMQMGLIYADEVLTPTRTMIDMDSFTYICISKPTNLKTQVLHPDL